MALKIMQEVTQWKVPYRQPNHVYLMSGDRIIAMSKWGLEPPEHVKSQNRIDRRGRKFIEVKKDRWGFDMTITVPTEEKPAGQTWQVRGSKGDVYTVGLSDGRWTCTCPGSMFRGTCRHITELAQTAK